jgi:hypothetical protein
LRSFLIGFHGSSWATLENRSRTKKVGKRKSRYLLWNYIFRKLFNKHAEPAARIAGLLGFFSPKAHQRSLTMADRARFGRKQRLPSTIQIKHDLVEMGRADTLLRELRKQSCTLEELNSIIGGLIAEHHISGDRARMLIDRSGREKAALAPAGYDLESRKHDCGIV